MSRREREIIKLLSTSSSFSSSSSFSLEVVLRAEAVEMAQAGDKCDFIGSLIVVPDVSQIQTQGGSSVGVACLSHCHTPSLSCSGRDCITTESGRGL